MTSGLLGVFEDIPITYGAAALSLFDRPEEAARAVADTAQKAATQGIGTAQEAVDKVLATDPAAQANAILNPVGTNPHADGAGFDLINRLNIQVPDIRGMVSGGVQVGATVTPASPFVPGNNKPELAA